MLLKKKENCETVTWTFFFFYCRWIESCSHCRAIFFIIFFFTSAVHSVNPTILQWRVFNIPLHGSRNKRNYCWSAHYYDYCYDYCRHQGQLWLKTSIMRKAPFSLATTTSCDSGALMGSRLLMSQLDVSVQPARLNVWCVKWNSALVCYIYILFLMSLQGKNI